MTTATTGVATRMMGTDLRRVDTPTVVEGDVRFRASGRAQRKSGLYASHRTKFFGEIARYGIFALDCDGDGLLRCLTS